jgi:hypothetical protein
MSHFYSAVVETSGGTFRAFFGDESTVFVMEEDFVGVADRIELDEHGSATKSPENLAQILVWWIYEMRRGVQILNVDVRLGQ